MTVSLKYQISLLLFFLSLRRNASSLAHSDGVLCPSGITFTSYFL